MIVALGAGALAAPVASFAQQQKVSRIGFLSLTTPWEAQDSFRDRLRELGYVDGRNISIVYRFASGNQERLDKDARDLVNAKVDIILAASVVGSLAAQKATHTYGKRLLAFAVGTKQSESADLAELVFQSVQREPRRFFKCRDRTGGTANGRQLR
jgi:ABC-type uncharacterized transport system substrate-binding protein